MVKFVDLEVDGDADGQPLEYMQTLEFRARAATASSDHVQVANVSAPERKPSCSTSLARAFQCYPIVISIVSCIDLNTLDALARSCRTIHDELIQYRSALLNSTLQCTFEDLPVIAADVHYQAVGLPNWRYLDDGRTPTGKSSSCARDMVNECRKCGEVICRNCTIKPPPTLSLRYRHRRLCQTCVKAPIAELAIPPLDPDLPLVSEAVQQSICHCHTSGVWLCQPCGKKIRSADSEYANLWRWLSNYGEVLGGLGTGISDGDRGITCGREELCLAARGREQEVDCDAQDSRDSGTAPWVNDPPVWTTTSTPSPPALAASDSPAGSPFGPATPIALLIEEERHERTPSPQLGPGYARHEIEGIGGRVKRKLVRMVRVGSSVPQWDDEKGLGSNVLVAEKNGCARSWCGWCWRAIPGQKDLKRKGTTMCGKDQKCSLSCGY